MQWLMKESGLKIVAVKPMWFDSFYVSLLSSKYKTGIQNGLAHFGQAYFKFQSNE
jgi:hypothetical protein